MYLKSANYHSTYKEFWIEYQKKKYIILKLFVVKICTIFGTTYVCESAFSENELHDKQIQISTHQRPPEHDNEDGVHWLHSKSQTLGWEQDLSFLSLMYHVIFYFIIL